MASRQSTNQNNGRVDARQIVISLPMGLMIIGAMATAILAGAASYYQIAYQLDSLGKSLAMLNDTSVSRTDLRLFCFELQQSNSKFVCPSTYTGVVEAKGSSNVARAPSVSARSQ